MARSQPAKNDEPQARKAKSAKGEQARKKLKRACLEVLERVGYHEMKVTDVTKEAGVASGLFYHYFKDLKSLTLEVLTDFVSESGNLEAIEKDGEQEINIKIQSSF